MNRIKHLVTWAEVFAWMALMFFLSGESFGAAWSWVLLKRCVDFLGISVSPPTLLMVHFLIRKAAHFTEFFVLGLLLSRALLGNLKEFRSKAAVWVVAIGLLCALGDEGHQMLFASRTPSLRDSFLDFSGVVASQLFLFLRSHFSHAGFVGAGSEGTSATPEESP